MNRYQSAPKLRVTLLYLGVPCSRVLKNCVQRYHGARCVSLPPWMENDTHLSSASDYCMCVQSTQCVRMRLLKPFRADVRLATELRFEYRVYIQWTHGIA